MTAGWDGQSVERAALYTLDIEEDAGDAARAVDLSGQGLGLHLQEVPLWDVFQRLTCTVAFGSAMTGSRGTATSGCST